MNRPRTRFDVAYGGAFYAIVDARPLGLKLEPEHFNQLVGYGRRIKLAATEAFTDRASV